MKHSAQNMKAGDVSLGLTHHFILAVVVAVTFVTVYYFTTRSAFWASNHFVSWINSVYDNSIVPRGLNGVESFEFELAKWSDNREIMAQMGGEENVRKHAFTLDQIAYLIDLQKKGEAGKLLMNGYGNIFHVVGKKDVLFVFYVHWNTDDRKWRVDTQEISEPGFWVTGSRVFYNVGPKSF